MSADDQAFLDVLSSVPNDIRRYSNDVADYVDRHLEKVSNVLREALSSSSWLPESARPRPLPPPPRSFIEKASTPTSACSRLYNWAIKYKALTTVIVIIAGGVTYHIIKKNTNNRKKRRAKRAGNGARLEVVVIAGSPSEPITRSVSLDLERRGFIVYIVCNNIDEEIQVQSEARPDIRPLRIDIVDPSSASESIERFRIHLQTPHAAFHGAKAHHLTLRSLIFIPSTAYPSAPIATLQPSALSDLLNTHVLTPILTLQTFLPLLQSLPFQHPQFHSTIPQPKPSVLVLTPSIISSLNPAFHLPEATVVSALTSFTSVLTAELSPLSIPVTHIQLGTFDVRAFVPHNKQLAVQASRAETLRWGESTRSSYARNYLNANNIKGSGGTVVGHGTNLRVLNDTIFDSMIRIHGGVVRVGMGSSLYGFVGRWVPKGLVSWMMGSRNILDRQVEFGRSTTPSDSFGRSSGSTSPGTQGASGPDGSEYIYDFVGDKEAYEVLETENE